MKDGLNLGVLEWIFLIFLSGLAIASGALGYMMVGAILVLMQLWLIVTVALCGCLGHQHENISVQARRKSRLLKRLFGQQKQGRGRGCTFHFGETHYDCRRKLCIRMAGWEYGTRPLGPKEKDGLLVPPGKASMLRLLVLTAQI